MQPEQADIDTQRDRLQSHRLVLAHSLQQQAILGVYTPPHVAIQIGEARAGIQRIKRTLRDWGVAVDDHPDDDGAAPAVTSTPGWQAEQSTLRVQVFEGSPVPGKLSVGASVTVHTFTDGETYTAPVDQQGIAAFRLRAVGSVALTVAVLRDARLQVAGIPGFTIPALPYLHPVNLAAIPADGWQIAEASMAAAPLGLASRPVAAQAAAAQTEIGDSRHQLDNAPWGVPTAEVVINRAGYILGYDPRNRIPRWTAYALAPDPLGSARRPDRFTLDPDLPASVQATLGDYVGSGYDRGHLVALRDLFFRGQRAVDEANYFSTLAPQTKHTNQRTWAAVEQYARELAATRHPLYITAGPVFRAAAPGRVEFFVIGRQKVAVPTHFFRVLSRRRKDGAPEALSFLVPNDGEASPKIADFLVSLEQIEALTGLTFFPTIDPAARARLAARAPRRLWRS